MRDFSFRRTTRPGTGTVLMAGVIAWLLMSPLLAAELEAEGIDWLAMGMGLFGGLALFLFGMEQMSNGLRAVAGESLKQVLAKLTTNRFLGAFTGAFVTAVLNSSSITTVLVVGFISAGLMTMTQSVGVIMGANIGSTVTAQIIAFNVSQYALIMVIIGFGMNFAGKSDNVRYYGAMIMGLGLVFYGMGIMSEAMVPLRSYQPFLDLMVRMEAPLLGILVGAVFTGLIQSSAATTGIAIVMATQGLITLPAGIALAFGANIGTCVTALLAAIGKPREALRAAAVHILFNVLGVLVWLPFIPQLADIVVALSPAHPELEGAARMAAEVPRQIANAHTVFNVANTLLFIGFTTYFARIVQWALPDKPESETIIVQPKFLDKELIAAPALALERARFELGRIGDIVHAMFERVPDAVNSGMVEPLDQIARMDDQVDILQGAVLEYLSQVRKQELTDHQSHEIYQLIAAADYLESIGDVIETELVGIGRRKLELGIESSDTMRAMMRDLHQSVSTALSAAVEAVKDRSERAAQDVVMLKDAVHGLVDDALRYQAGKLDVSEEKRLETFRLEMEAVDKLKRVYALSKRIAKGTLPAALAGSSE